MFVTLAKGRPDRFRGHGQIPYPSPSGRKNSIGYGRSNRRQARLANSTDLSVTVHNMHFDLTRGLTHTLKMVVEEISGSDYAVSKINFLL